MIAAAAAIAVCGIVAEETSKLEELQKVCVPDFMLRRYRTGVEANCNVNRSAMITFL